MKKLFLIRHGQSVANVDRNVYCEIPDHLIPLTEVGILQAIQAGKELHQLILEDPIDDLVFVHSSWKRAKDTCNILYSEFSSLMNKEYKIIESLLCHERVVTTNIEDMVSKCNLTYHQRLQDYGKFWYKDKSIESFAETYQRALLFLQSLDFFTDKASNIVIVSHGEFISAVEGILNKLNLSEMEGSSIIKNCQILKYEI